MRLRLGHSAAIPLWLIVFLVAAPVQVNSTQYFFSLGAGDTSCRDFLRAADAERKRRPANPAPNDVYDVNFMAYLSFANGFLTGTNYSDPTQGVAGEHTDTNGRMVWLENYCRKHPRDDYTTALIQLRNFLLK